MSALCALLAARCDKPMPVGPDTTLELVRRALATNDPAIETLADGRFVAEVGYVRTAINAVHMAAHGHGEHNERLTPRMFERSWQDLQSMEHPARESLRAAIPWLGGGRCSFEGAASVPDAFARLPEAPEGLPAMLAQRRAQLDVRLATVLARRYRCAPGVAIRVTFVSGEAPSSAPRLLAIQRD